MAPLAWSSLPPDILSMISKILNTDVDTLRLRSVCSSWRSSLPPRLRPSSFPLKVPSPWNCASRARCAGGRYLLNYATLYRLSPPEIGPRAGDPSDGWLFRVLEVNPNRFSLLSPLVPIKANCAPGTIPKHLNLLEYRITEICKCYSLTFVDSEGAVKDLLGSSVGKITVLWNDCDFVVFVLLMDSTGSLWKYGDKDWTPIDLMGYGICDLMASNGKCYAISDKGVLLSFDSNLKLTVIPMPRFPVSSFYRTVNYLLEYKSDLYVVLRTYEEISSSDDEDGFDYEEAKTDTYFRLKIFKKCNNNWKHMKCLQDEFFLSCEDVSIGLPAEDFRSSKGNCVYVAISNVIGFSCYRSRVTNYGVCDLAEGGAAVMKLVKDDTFMNWPPPKWLLSG